MSPYLVLPILLLLSLPSYAQVYKCKSTTQKVIYSDSPCPAGNTEVVTNIKLNETEPTSNVVSSAHVMRQLDSAVKSAIAAGDWNRAKALATSPLHRQWITEALTKENNQPQKSEAMLKTEMASSSECISARRNLENVANSREPDANVLDARRSLMHSACGSAEPYLLQQPQPRLVYGYPYRFRPNEYGRFPHQDRYQKEHHHNRPHQPHQHGGQHKSTIQLEPSNTGGGFVTSSPIRVKNY